MTNSHTRTLCRYTVFILLLVIPLQAQVATPGVTSTSIEIGS